MEKIVQETIQEWLNCPLDRETKIAIEEMVSKQNLETLNDAFSSNLSFGTGGMRGLMGIGSNRLNLYTIAKATLACGLYFQSQTQKKPALSAVIGFDCRHGSKAFAKKAADILSSLQIHTLVTHDLRPTPFVSFLVHHEKADFGIMITASHNPKEYNGFKVYNRDGGQLVFPDDHEVEKLLNQLNLKALFELPPPRPELIRYTTKKEDEAYLQALSLNALQKDQDLKQGHTLKILYTNLHGTGRTLVPEALNQLGFSRVDFVDQQMPYDGDFPFAPSPNPEDKKALELGLNKMAQAQDYDLFIATDPDADRLAATLYHENTPYILSGNEMAVLALDYLIKQKKRKNQLTSKHVVISTIVSSRLIKKLCETENIRYMDVLTGFKYIGEKMSELEHQHHLDQFLFGAEESYGFLYGTQAKDKDGIAAACLMAEMSLEAKEKNQTLLDSLYEIYQKHGLYREGQITISLPFGELGQKQKHRLLEALFNYQLKTIDSQEIVQIDDYRKSLSLHLSTKKTTKIPLPQSDVLTFHLADQTLVVIRPSGTEPKIKIYANLILPSFLNDKEAFDEATSQLNERLNHIKKTLINLIF